MIRIFDYLRSSISAKIRLYGYGAKSWWGLTWGQWDSIGSKKWVTTVKKLPYPKIRIFDYPAVIDFDQNSNLR